MNSKERLLVGTLTAAASLPFISWLFSAVGLPCRSILDGEGLRWLFRHGGDCLGGRLMTFAFCGVVLLGAAKRSGLLPLSRAVRRPRMIRYAVICAIVLCLFLLLALSAESPLLSLTGGIAGSPFLDGLPLLTWTVAVSFCLCYGQSDGIPLSDMLTYGLRRYPIVLVLAAVVSFVILCVTYMIG